VKSFSIADAEPLSSDTSMTPFAPAARHACACAFCFSGSLRALFIEYVTLAFLSAAPMYFGSNCVQRTDDFVSGSRTQTCTLADFLAVLATAAAEMAMAATAAPSTRIKLFFPNLFTLALLVRSFWMCRPLYTHESPRIHPCPAPVDRRARYYSPA